MFDIKKYRQYLECDEPIPYKGIVIYPVKIKDYSKFLFAANCLNIDKDMLSPEIAAMSYIDFLTMLMVTQEHGDKMMSDFATLAKLCFHLDIKDFNFNVEEDNHSVFVVGKNVFKKKEFDEIRRIILYQNIPGFDDSYVDPELAKALDEERELRSRKSGVSKRTFEDQIAALSVLTGFTFDYIYSMPIRRFFVTLDKAISRMEYQIIRTGQMSGMVKLEKAIPDWVASDDGADVINERLGQYGELKKKIGTV